jgi:hypothetical protein
MSSTNNIRSREHFFKVYGRYPVTKEDTEFIDIGDYDSDEEVSTLVQQMYDLDQRPDTPHGLRSPETVNEIQKISDKLYRQKEQERREDEEEERFRQQIRAYWQLKKIEEEQREQKRKEEERRKSNTSNTSNGGHTRRKRCIKPSMRRKRTYGFRRKSIKRHNRHSSSRRK